MYRSILIIIYATICLQIANAKTLYREVPKCRIETPVLTILKQIITETDSISGLTSEERKSKGYFFYIDFIDINNHQIISVRFADFRREICITTPVLKERWTEVEGNLFFVFGKNK